MTIPQFSPGSLLCSLRGGAFGRSPIPVDFSIFRRESRRIFHLAPSPFRSGGGSARFFPVFGKISAFLFRIGLKPGENKKRKKSFLCEKIFFRAFLFPMGRYKMIPYRARRGIFVLFPFFRIPRHRFFPFSSPGGWGRSGRERVGLSLFPEGTTTPSGNKIRINFRKIFKHSLQPPCFVV